MPRKASELNWAETLLGAMASRHRLVVLEAIRRREMTVGEMCEVTGLSQSALSQHLAKLRAIEIVSTRREGQNIYYRCASYDVELLLDAITGLTEGYPRNRAA